jgi:muramidase (phage lysozyme)
MSALDTCTAALGNANVKAFLHVIREGESSHDPSAYTVVNGGAHFEAPPWKHPFDNVPTTQGGRAAGSYQFLGTTWHRCANALGLDDFSPVSQDLGAVYLIDSRGALAAVMNGDLVLACSKLAQEWVSLPALGLERVQRVFLQYGGSLSPNVQQELAVSVQQPEKPMGPLFFLPAILEAIPQLIALFGTGARGQQNAQAASVVVDAFKKAVPNAVNEQDAIQKVQADPALAAQVKATVMSDPNVLALMEVGGGVKEARAADLAWAAAPKPFYKSSPVFWISMILLPMVVWYVGSSIAGGVPIPPEWPWYAQLPLKLLGGAWDAGARVGLANLVVGLVLGGICGVYFGVSVTQNNQRRGSDAPAP